MKIYCILLLALLCLNGFISGIHLPLNDYRGAKLINSKVYGNVKINNRGEDKILTFNGNNGPSYMKYFIHENITTSADSCFKSLSHCHDFIIKFWFKYHTNVSDSRQILRQGPDNNHKKGLNVLMLPYDTLQISHDDGKAFKVIVTKYKPEKWNFVKLTSANGDLNLEINGLTVKSTTKPSIFNSEDIRAESLIVGFENIAKGSYVSFDDYKLELPNLTPNNVKTINSDSGKKLRYNGRNHIEVDFKNKLRHQSNQEELDITFKFPSDSTSGLIWYSEKGAEKSFVYLKESKLYYVYIFKQYKEKAKMRTTEEISVPDILPPNTYHRLVIRRQADKLETSQNLTLSINEVVRANKEIIEGSLPMILPGGKVFVGGHYNTKIVTEGRIETQFKGEINEVVVKGNNHDDYNFIELMQSEGWKENIQNRGSVEISIHPNDGSRVSGSHSISETPIPVTVKQFNKVVRLKPWNFEEYESIELEFRTKEPRGIIFFVGPQNGHTDYVCLEFFDRNLYFAFGVDNQNYRIQLNPRNEPATTGKFHRVYLKRNRFHNFILKYDNKDVPVVKQNAHQNAFGSYTYIGGIDSPSRLPWYVWNRIGFVGCINYIRFNNDKYINPRGQNNQHSSEIDGLEIGGKCLDDVPSCTASKCGAGVCHDRTYPFNSDINFYCDCSRSVRTYKTPADDITRSQICQRVSEDLVSKGSSFYVVDFKNENSQNRMMLTHSDDIAFSFKTRQMSGTLFRTYRTKPNLFFALELENGYVKLRTNINDIDGSGDLTTLTVQRPNLNDGQWHTVYIKRRADFISMYVDDESTLAKGRINVISKTFNNVFEYILIGSSNFETNDVKMKASFRNFYWNQYDFLGTRRLVGTYRGTIKTPKPVDPPLPPYPRDPPVQCTMTAEHKFTHVTDVATTSGEVGFFIEFKTRYNGVIWHAYDNLNPNGRYMTLLVIDNRLLLVYRLNEDEKVQIVEDGSRFSCNDNNWHRVTIMIHKTLKRITVLSDKDITPVIYYLALNQPLKFNKMSFYFGGMPKEVYDIVFRQLRLVYPNLAQKISGYNEYSLTGCLGDFLTSESDFKRNLFSGAKQTYPLNTLDCSGCKDPMKCVPGYCKNGGSCVITPNTNRISCNCVNTGFIGQTCEKRQPRCPSGYCANGGRCFISNNQPRCDCSNTGYRGDRCQISHCSANYCYNGGVCRIVNSQPTCDCKNTNYMGKLCNDPICPINYCQNGGRCYVNNRKPQCDCLGTGYSGMRCDYQICRPNFCLNGGTCIPRNNKATCNCQLGFEGSNCERKVCTDDYCYNGGKCVPYMNSKKCICTSNFEGQLCEIEKKCPFGYCQNGGSCFMDNGSPRCDCSRVNRRGDRCQYLIECPAGYCANNGVCSIRNNGYYCTCLSTYIGDRCQYRDVCPTNYCKNNGICQLVNNKYVCHCQKTGFTGSKCEQNAIGILTDYTKDGYATYNINPITTNKNSISVGFQTYMPTGTIFTLKTTDNKYIALKLKDGKLVVDANGELNYLVNSVNDGSYYVVSLERKNGFISVKVNGKENESSYFKIDNIFDNTGTAQFNKIFVGVDHRLSDSFKGAIGGFVYDGTYIMKAIKIDPNLRVGQLQIINIPLNLARPPTQCPPNYCRNNGICQMVEFQPLCTCEKTGYFGRYCEKQTKGIFPKPGTDGGYMILRLAPPKTTNKDSMTLLLQTLRPNNPVVRFELTNGHYYEIRMIDGKLYLFTSNNKLIPINDRIRLDNGNPYLVEFSREDGRLVFKINGDKSGSISIKDLTTTDGMITHKQIVLGADKQLRKYFKGAIGGFNWNGYKMIKSTGGTNPNVVTKGTVTIVVMPKLNVTVIPTIRPPVVVPEQVDGKLHGGVVWASPGTIYIPGIGIGGGGIVPAGVGPTIVGAGSATGVLMLGNPLIAGLVMAGLLLLSAMIWACWRCKPGCCPCCAGVTKGAGAGGLKSRILTPIQAASFGTGGAGASSAGRTGEKSFWSKMKTTVTTPGVAAGAASGHRDIYESSGNKVESHALLSPNGMGNGYHTAARDERFNTTNLRGSSNMLDVNDYRFGTMGHGSIMRIDTTHHEMDGGGGGPNVFGEEMKVDCCVLSENSRYAVTGSEVGLPQVWDMQTGELCKVMDGIEMGATHLHLACGDSVLVGLVATDESRRLKRLQIWDFVSGAQIAMPNDIVCSATAVTHAGNHLILHREHPNNAGPPSILVWDLAANQPLQEIQYDPPAHLYPNHEGVNFLQVAPGDRMVVAGFTGEDEQAHYMVFDTSASYPSGVVVQPLLLSIDAKVSATALIGPEEAITGTKKGELIVWNLRSAKPVRQVLINAHLDGGTSGMTTQLNPHKDAIQCVALSNDGQYLATGSTDRTVNVYTMADERLLHSLEGHADDVLSVVISNDNEIIVSGSWDGSMRVWKLETGDPMCWFTSNIEILHVKLTNDKKAIVALGERMGMRKLVMLQIIRNKSRRTRHTDNTIGSPSVSTPLSPQPHSNY